MNITINEAPYTDVLQMRQQVMYPGKDTDYVKLPDDDMGIHMGVYEGGEMIGCVSLFMHPERKVQFRKLAIRTDKQRQGYGSALLRWLIDYARDVKLNSLWCNARTDAAEFYKQEGFTETDNRFARENGYTYVVMEITFDW